MTKDPSATLASPVQPIHSLNQQLSAVEGRDRSSQLTPHKPHCGA